jgi:hypothetical protein
MLGHAVRQAFSHLSDDYETYRYESAMFGWPKNAAYFAFVRFFCGYRGLR